MGISLIAGQNFLTRSADHPVRLARFCVQLLRHGLWALRCSRSYKKFEPKEWLSYCTHRIRAEMAVTTGKYARLGLRREVERGTLRAGDALLEDPRPGNTVEVERIVGANRTAGADQKCVPCCIDTGRTPTREDDPAEVSNPTTLKVVKARAREDALPFPEYTAEYLKHDPLFDDYLEEPPSTAVFFNGVCADSGYRLTTNSMRICPLKIVSKGQVDPPQMHRAHILPRYRCRGSGTRWAHSFARKADHHAHTFFDVPADLNNEELGNDIVADKSVGPRPVRPPKSFIYEVKLNKGKMKISEEDVRRTLHEHIPMQIMDALIKSYMDKHRTGAVVPTMSFVRNMSSVLDAHARGKLSESDQKREQALTELAEKAS